MKIVISIPVHEKPEVLLDQIDNIKKFIKDAEIIIHLSRELRSREFVEQLEKIENVFCNPLSVKTGWGNICHAHISNFKYMDQKEDFDYFVLHASNDMYVRKGLSNYIGSYTAGFQQHRITGGQSLWWPAEIAKNDPVLWRIVELSGAKGIVASQIEGSFYEKKLMKKLVKIIEEAEVQEESPAFYTREEFYFPTAASAFVSENKIGRPTTFSEIHRYDRIFFRCLKGIRKAAGGFPDTPFFHRVQRRIEELTGSFLKLLPFYKTTKHVVRQVRKKNQNYLEKYKYLEDGNVRFELYGEELFSVKRIQRNNRDRVRRYIRKLVL